jgi:hypothetical protein
MLEQTNPRITPASANGLFCAWRDDYTNIYAQRLDANGVGLWQPGGVVVASGSNELALSNAVGTSNGLYGVAYGEYVSSTTNELVKAQALDAAGNLKWSAGGEPVSTVVSPKSRINAIADTCGGVVAVWQDDRNGSYASDIFAQRVDPPVGIEETKPFSKTMTVLHCLPNPCHNSTVIKYQLYRKTSVRLCVYDAAGGIVKNLWSGVQESGLHELAWNARGKTGVGLPGGVYFVTLEIEGAGRFVTKVILVR